MKSYLKRIAIMFALVISVLSINMTYNGITANAVTVEDTLSQAELGWTRYDDTNECIVYPENTSYQDDWLLTNCYSGTSHSATGAEKIVLYFKGTKFRLISYRSPTKEYVIDTYIDGKLSGSLGGYSAQYKGMSVFCDAENLDDTVHKVEIESRNKNGFILDAIDINNEGYLIKPSINFNTSEVNLKEGESKDNVAAVNPSNEKVVWSSSDESIAQVSSNGVITGIKEGKAIITAQIEGGNIKDTCNATVSKDDLPKPEPVVGSGNLYINMLDGNIKQAENIDINNFITWYTNRDLDKSESPFYKIVNSKGNIEYLIHDKIVSFEIK